MITHFNSAFDGSNNSRFNYIAANISKLCDLEMLTTSFSHGKKTHRKKIEQFNGYKVIMLHEPAYFKNISLQRFWAHMVFAKNVKKYLKNIIVKPDVIYCSVPSLSVGAVVSEYAKTNNVKLVLDIQDLWPEAFQMAFNFPFIYQPLKILANKIYNAADEIIAVSQTFADRAFLVNKKAKRAFSVFLGTDLAFFDQNKQIYKKNKSHDKFEIAYCGSLEASYDIKCVIDAMAILQDQGFNNISFIVMGDGSYRNKFESYANQKSVSCSFLARIPYPEMCGILNSCDIAVNPIVANSAASIINKHADYAAAGIPVINSQESIEYKKLVDEFKMGFNCKNGDSLDMANKIKYLIEDENTRLEMGKNARKCAEIKFDRRLTYKKIYSLLLDS